MIVFIVVILAMIGVFSLRLYKTQAAVTPPLRRIPSSRQTPTP